MGDTCRSSPRELLCHSTDISPDSSHPSLSGWRCAPGVDTVRSEASDGFDYGFVTHAQESCLSREENNVAHIRSLLAETHEDSSEDADQAYSGKSQLSNSNNGVARHIKHEVFEADDRRELSPTSEVNSPSCETSKNQHEEEERNLFKDDELHFQRKSQCAENIETQQVASGLHESLDRHDSCHLNTGPNSVTTDNLGYSFHLEENREAACIKSTPALRTVPHADTAAQTTITGTVIFVGTNQDDTLATMGTAEGAFFIFSVVSGACLHKQENCGGPVVLIELLLCSSIVAVVVATCIEPYTHNTIASGQLLHHKRNHLLSCDSKEDLVTIFDYGCRDVQLWNIKASSRIAVVSFPTARRGFPSQPLPAETPCVKDCTCVPHQGNVTSQQKTALGLDSAESQDISTEPDGPSLQSQCNIYHPSIVAVRLSHRRLVVLLDCPSAEIEVLDLQTLRLVHRLERNVIIAPNVVQSKDAQRIGEKLTRFGSSAFLGAHAQNSLAGVASLAIHPCHGLLAVPIGVASVNVDSLSNFSKASWAANSTVYCKPFTASNSLPLLSGVGKKLDCNPVADRTLVTAAALKGAFKNHDEIGSIVLVDLHGPTARFINSAKVHEHPISALAFNGAATLLVTASVKGTIVRLWGVPSLEQLWCWRRGSRPISIPSIKFTWDSEYVLCTSYPHHDGGLSLATLSSTPGRYIMGAAATFSRVAGGSSGHNISTTELTGSRTAGHPVYVYLFLCTRSWSNLQRRKHLPPYFPYSLIHRAAAINPEIGMSIGAGAMEANKSASDAGHPVEGTLTSQQHWWVISSDARATTCYKESYIVTGGTRELNTEEIPENPISEHSTTEPFGSNAPKQDSSSIRVVSPTQLSNWTTLFPPRLKSHAAGSHTSGPPAVGVPNWISDTARMGLRNVISKYLIPNLPGAVRENWVEPQRWFARARVQPGDQDDADTLPFQFPLSAMTRHLCITPVAIEKGYRYLELRVFCDTGCVLGYMCNTDEGGNARYVEGGVGVDLNEWHYNAFPF